MKPFIIAICLLLLMPATHAAEKHATVAYANLAFDKREAELLYPYLQDKYQESITEQSNKPYKDIVFTGEDVNVDDLDKAAIIKQCAELGVDGIVIARLEFMKMTYTIAFIPISQNYDTRVEMQYVNSKGEIIASATHSTLANNSYWRTPTIETTINDGIKGALKKLVKKLNKQGIDLK